MAITRRLLTPILLLFTALLVVGAVYSAITANRRLQAEENARLAALTAALDAELNRVSDLALALAKSTVANPEIQAAFAAQDRQRLLVLTQPVVRSLQADHRFVVARYTLAPAVVVLDLDQPEVWGVNAEPAHPSLLKANTESYALSVIQPAASGLIVSGIAPIRVETGGRLLQGSLELGFALDPLWFDRLRREYGGEWTLILPRSTWDQTGFATPSGLTAGPAADLLVASSTLSTPVFASEAVYRRALSGEPSQNRVRTQSGVLAVRSVPLNGFANQSVGVLDLAWEITDILNQTRVQILVVAAAGAIGLLLIAFLLGGWVRRTLQPIQALTLAAQGLADGNLRQPLPPVHQKPGRGDELESLKRSFNRMALQMRELVGGLEQMVLDRTASLERRTAQLQAAAEIGREMASQTDIHRLLAETVDLICRRFDFYHAGVFLIDESGEQAVLRAATGKAGKAMLANGHHLPVGRVGIVGAACAAGTPRVAELVDADPAYYKNPLLPETQAEAAVPLRAGDRVIGALDVQSRQPQPFKESDILALQIIADQLAVAVTTAQHIGELRQSLAELEAAHAQTLRQTWQAAVSGRSGPSGYRWSTPGAAAAAGLAPLDPDNFPVGARQAIHAGTTIIDPAGSEVSVPIRLRDQVIGAIQLRFDRTVDRYEIARLVEGVSSRLGLVLESARLLEEAQRLAQREGRINRIATEMRASAHLDTILQNTVRELGQTLGARRATIQLGGSTLEDLPVTPPAVELASENLAAEKEIQASSAGPNGSQPSTNGNGNGPVQAADHRRSR